MIEVWKVTNPSGQEMGYCIGSTIHETVLRPFRGSDEILLTEVQAYAVLKFLGRYTDSRNKMPDDHQMAGFDRVPDDDFFMRQADYLVEDAANLLDQWLIDNAKQVWGIDGYTWRLKQEPSGC